MASAVDSFGFRVLLDGVEIGHQSVSNIGARQSWVTRMTLH
jgi:hypothetical protein